MNRENLSNNNAAENPWTDFSMRELPTTSANSTCRFYLQEIERLGRLSKVAHFIDEKLLEDPKIYASVEDFISDNPDYAESLDDTLSQDQKTAIKEYSGFRFAWINSVMRGFWDYDKMGKKTPELEAEIRTTAHDIDAAISIAPAPKSDFITFRGTNIDAFRNYDIQNLADLKALEGQFYLEEGFTSTAIVRDKSFVERAASDLWIKQSNIEVRYHIPAESHDSLALLSHELSYNPEQTEVLLNRHTLSYISEVSIAENSHATIDALLSPRELYEPNLA